MLSRLLLLLAAFLLTAPALRAGEDIKLTDGTLLKNARIAGVDGAVVVVIHQGGEARVPLRRFEPARQQELLGVSIGSVTGLTTNASRAAAAAAQEASDRVVVTATAIPVVERFALTPEDALAKRLFEDIAKKRAARSAKDAPKNFYTLPVWRFVPFRLVDINAADPAPSNAFRYNLQNTSAQTYGAPDPRTGK